MRIMILMTSLIRSKNRKAKLIFEYEAATVRLTNKTKTKFLKLLALEQLRSDSVKVLSADNIMQLLLSDYESLHRVQIK